MAEPLLEARGIVKSFGRVQRAARRELHGATPARSSRWSATTAPARARWSRRCRASTTPDDGEILLRGPAGDDRLAPSPRASSASRPSTRTSRSPPTSSPRPTSSSAARSRAAGCSAGSASSTRRAMRRRTAGGVRAARRRRAGRRPPRSRRSPAASARASRSPARSPGPSKVVFMDEPTAALGVVQTRNVLDLILRVRETGLSVVLISHNMPEVMEVSDRVEVLRLGERVARFTTAETSMEELVGAMTGALAREDERPASSSRARTSAERAALAATGTGSTTWIILILAGMIVVFSVLEPELVRDRQQRAQPGHQRRDPARGRGRDDVRDHHRRHRPVGRRGARVLRRRLGQGDERHGRRRRRRAARRPARRAGGRASAGACSTASSSPRRACRR